MIMDEMREKYGDATVLGVAADCQKTLPGGLEGQSPPNAIRIR